MVLTIPSQSQKHPEGTMGPFLLPNYLDKYNPMCKHSLANSDAESLQMKDLVNSADEETKELWENLSLSYGESKGHPILRKEIAKRYKTIKADEIVTAAPQEAIFIASQVLGQTIKQETPSPEVIVMYPNFQALSDCPKYNGCKIVRWKATYDRKTGWSFDINELSSLLTENTRMLITNVPHNPTGYYPSSEEWGSIIDFCKEHNLYLLSDDIYSMMPRLDGQDYNQYSCDLYEKAFSITGLSKTMGCPGIRVGWIASHNKELLKQMADFKEYVTYCSGTPCEILGIMALRHSDSITADITEIVNTNLDACDQLFLEFSNLFEWKRPVCGTVAFVRIRGWLKTLGSGGATGFANVLREKKKVLVAPSNLFNFEDSYIRLGFGRKEFKKGLEILRTFLFENMPC